MNKEEFVAEHLGLLTPMDAAAVARRAVAACEEWERREKGLEKGLEEEAKQLHAAFHSLGTYAAIYNLSDYKPYWIAVARKAREMNWK